MAFRLRKLEKLNSDAPSNVPVGYQATGGVSISLRAEAGPEGLIEGWIQDGNRPKVGCVIEVRQATISTYAFDQQLSTSVITEILIDQEDYMKFVTQSAIYEWWQI